METMTVKEVMTFVAMLKQNADSVEFHVDRMLEVLEIDHARNSMIGSSYVRGISGGERKRVAIGLELLTGAPMVFMDEPTTGLDSMAAERIIDMCVKGIQLGRTVLATMH
jgi:ABC-type multidrug transport system ATPase subunit